MTNHLDWRRIALQSSEPMLQHCTVYQSYTITIYRRRHQRRLANCDWMPASCTSGQPSNPRRHPTCWALSHWSHTISRTSCHGAWTPAPLSAHPSIESACSAPQNETSICTRRTTSHQFIWQQQHMCCALGGSPMECGMGGKPTKLRISSPTPASTHAGVPKQPGSGLTASHLPYIRRKASTADCECGREEQTVDHVFFQCPIHRPPHGLHGLHGSGRWDNRMAAQHLPKIWCCQAVVRRTGSKKKILADIRTRLPSVIRTWLLAHICTRFRARSRTQLFHRFRNRFPWRLLHRFMVTRLSGRACFVGMCLQFLCKSYSGICCRFQSIKCVCTNLAYSFSRQRSKYICFIGQPFQFDESRTLQALPQHIAGRSV